jgi:hypothetical protein
MAVVEVVTRAIPTRKNEQFNVPMPTFDGVSARDADALAQTLNDLATRTEENFKQVSAIFRGGIVTIELTSDGQVVLDASRSTSFIVPITTEIPDIKGIDVQNTDCGQTITVTFRNDTVKPIELNQWPPNVSGTEESLDVILEPNSKMTFRFLVTGDDCDELTLLSTSGNTFTQRISCEPSRVETTFNDADGSEGIEESNPYTVSEENTFPPCSDPGRRVFTVSSGDAISVRGEIPNFGACSALEHGVCVRNGTFNKNQFIAAFVDGPVSSVTSTVSTTSWSWCMAVRLSGTWDNYSAYLWAIDFIHPNGVAYPSGKVSGDYLRMRLYKAQNASTSSLDNGGASESLDTFQKDERPGITLLFDNNILSTETTWKLSAECDHIKVWRGFGDGETLELIADVIDGDITTGSPGFVSQCNGPISQTETSFVASFGAITGAETPVIFGGRE